MNVIETEQDTSDYKILHTRILKYNNKKIVKFTNNQSQREIESKEITHKIYVVHPIRGLRPRPPNTEISSVLFN